MCVHVHTWHCWHKVLTDFNLKYTQPAQVPFTILSCPWCWNLVQQWRQNGVKNPRPTSWAGTSPRKRDMEFLRRAGGSVWPMSLRRREVLIKQKMSRCPSSGSTLAWGSGESITRCCTQCSDCIWSFLLLSLWPQPMLHLHTTDSLYSTYTSTLLPGFQGGVPEVPLTSRIKFHSSPSRRGGWVGVVLLRLWQQSNIMAVYTNPTRTHYKVGSTLNFYNSVETKTLNNICGTRQKDKYLLSVLSNILNIKMMTMGSPGGTFCDAVIKLNYKCSKLVPGPSWQPWSFNTDVVTIDSLSLYTLLLSDLIKKKKKLKTIN